MRINSLNPINVQLPERDILFRLKYNIHKTVIDHDSLARIKGIMYKGFRLCEPQGVWGRLGIAEIVEERVIFESGAEIRSASIAQLLSGSHSAVFMAATVGPQIVHMASEAVSAGDGGAAVIYDAVGSETAEAAIEWLTGYIGSSIKKKGESLTSIRFSPGYGDFKLEYQSLFYDLLKLNEMGITLTERFILVPEKTVTALAGISG
jgi:hypothetical protein